MEIHVSISVYGTEKVVGLIWMPISKLSNAAREKIRLEEIYRNEVRADIANGKTPLSRWGQTWSFLNTSLGIWMLSSVLLSGFGFLFASYQDQLIADRNTTSVVRKLDVEIASRLRQWNRLGDVPEIRRDFASPGMFARYYGWLTKAPNISGQYVYVVYPIFPEFENRPLISLLTELRSHSKGADGQNLDGVIDNLVSWNPIISSESSFDRFRSKVQKLLLLPRWEQEKSKSN